jgi:hypothetical protein
MPRGTHPSTLYKLVVLDASVPQHQRIAALRWLGESASLQLLKTLIQSDSTPGRMKGIAADMYAAKCVRLYRARQERRQQATPIPKEDHEL